MCRNFRPTAGRPSVDEYDVDLALDREPPMKACRLPANRRHVFCGLSAALLIGSGVVCAGCASSNSSGWAQTAPSIPQSSDDSARGAMRDWNAATAIGALQTEPLRQ
jgi:hypothetical protein